ncbi:MAG: HlyC/CorC family transporter [Myxococcales bacterium]|nr:HlyC/CorC family transporter [Myxococcales bacterium]MCB9627995.1 HlyC/CorC family transporter [Sandaracinaceae bacterium]
MTEKLILTAVFIFLNGFFVAAEFALVKTRPTRVESLAAGGDRRAKRLMEIVGELDLYLSGCQLGITIASLVLGYLAEPAFAELFEQAAVGLGLATHAQLATPGANPILHYVSFGAALTIVTVLHMVLGEQAPKIWAIHSAERAALRFAFPLWLFTTVLRPVIRVVNAMSNALLRVVGIHDSHGEHNTDVLELKGIIAAAASSGNITSKQRILAENILNLVHLEVRHVMTPRTEIDYLDVADDVEENLARIGKRGHSRWPLCDGDLDHVLGMLLVRDIFETVLDGTVDRSALDLQKFAREPLYVPNTQPLSRFISESQRTGSQGALVLDEHGTVVGMVFLEDALEEIVGPLHDERDPQTKAVILEVSRAEGVFEMDGSVDFPEAVEVLGLETDEDVDTIGGLVVALLGRLPRQGDELQIEGYTVSVLSVRARRIERLRFVRKPLEEGDATA